MYVACFFDVVFISVLFAFVVVVSLLCCLFSVLFVLFALFALFGLLFDFVAVPSLFVLLT